MSDDKKERNFVKFEGKCMWAKVLPGQAEPVYKAAPQQKDDLIYSIQVECDDDKLRGLKKKGLMKQYTLKEEENKETGEIITYIGLKTLKQKTQKDNQPPKILQDLKVIDKYRQPVTEQIGNGSGVIVIAELKDSGNKEFAGKVLRLLCVQVLDHVVYAGTDNNIENYSDLLVEEKAPEEVTTDNFEDGENDDDESYL